VTEQAPNPRGDDRAPGAPDGILAYLDGASAAASAPAGNRSCRLSLLADLARLVRALDSRFSYVSGLDFYLGRDGVREYLRKLGPDSRAA
jgi:hypothetical protein